MALAPALIQGVAFPTSVDSIEAEGTPSATTHLRGDGTWAEIPSGTGAVNSVNGQTGEVVLNADDVNALSEDAFTKTPYMFGAVGDGVTNDDAAFSTFESVVSGKIVDLGGRNFVVSSKPTKNAYINGVFSISGFPKPAAIFDTFANVPPRFHTFGGQLRKLRAALANPLHQHVRIVFIGDSITWGSGATGTGVSTPRDGTLSDPRALFGATSFVNEFKRYLQSEYKKGDDLSEIISNWSASPSGESTVLYSNTELLYPRYGQFTVSTIGAYSGAADLSSGNSPTQKIMSLNNTVDAAQYGHSIAFNMTGDRFTISVRTSSGGSLDAYFDVLVDGVFVKTVDARPGGAEGLVDNVSNYDQQIEVTLGQFVKNKTVTIRTNRNGLSGQRLLSVTALRIKRFLTVVNNGIIGKTSLSYKANCIDDLTDGAPIVSSDQFVFVQIGTNDRAKQSTVASGSNQFEVNLKALLDTSVFSGKDVILMAANPAANEDSELYKFHMQEVRNIVYRVAEERSLDMIDNYSLFRGIDSSVYTNDGLHPNDLGHAMIARNMIGALESA